MKIALCIAGLDERAGGPPRSVTQLAEALSQLDHDVVVVTKETKRMVELPPSVKIAVYRRSPTEHEATFRAVDLVHDNGIWEPENLRVCLLTLKHGKKLIISPRGALEPWALAHHKFRKSVAWHLYQKRLLRSASGILVTAKSEGLAVRQVLEPKKLGIAPNGVDLEKFTPPLPEQRKKQFLFLSRLHPKKGLENLLRAWQTAGLKDWRLIIAGEGEAQYTTELKQLASPCPNVDFVGPIYGENKVRLYQESSFFVLPTFSENFGMVVVEALATGCPVITTHGTPWESLIQQRCGFWVEATEDALCSALLQAASASNYEELSRNARHLAEAEYGWATAARAVAHFYREVLDEF